MSKMLLKSLVDSNFIHRKKKMFTNEIVNIILPYFVQSHFQQHVDRSETRERHVDLLLVGL